MWKKIIESKPTLDGVYTVFGVVNSGSEFETKCRFMAKWQLDKFYDLNGERLTDNYENISHWFDFDEIEDPICRCKDGTTVCSNCF